MILRGDVWWVRFGPSVGGEIRKTRPAVIVSNNASNRRLNRLQVIPISSKTAKIYSGQVLVRVEGRQSKAMADQMMTVSKTRLSHKFGRVRRRDMADIDLAVKTQLGLS